MASKEKMINEFLWAWRDTMLRNPNFDPSKNDIYSQLIRLGVDKKDHKVSLDQSCFPRWISYFKNQPHIECFVSESWRYFCQFINRDREVIGQPDQIKIYIPQDAKHIEKSAEELFSFLRDNNIPHHSKIGRAIRFDDIVIRVANREDANRILDFARRNKQIQKGMIQPNPFTFNNDGIAMAVDGSVSYNETVSKYISLYLLRRKKENKLASVNCEDFYHFIAEYMQNFTSKEGMEQVIDDFKLEKEAKGYQVSIPSLLANYANVTSLIIKSHSPSFTEEDYYQHFNQCNNPTRVKAQEEQFSSILYSAVAYKSMSEEEVSSTLNWMVDQMCTKYGKEETLALIELYIKTGDERRLSRVGGVRDKIIDSTFRRDIIKILNSRGIDFKAYYSLCAATKTEETPTIDLELQTQMLNLLMEAIKLLMVRFDSYGAAIDNIEAYLKTNDPMYITSKENLRARVVSSPFRDFINEYLKKKNISFRKLVQLLPTASLDPSSPLDEAINETYQKYQALYECGRYQYSGMDQVHFAITKLLEEHSYQGFTDQKGARTKLANSLSVQDCLMLMCQKAKIPSKSVMQSKEVLNMLISTYSDMVITQEKEKQY